MLNTRFSTCTHVPFSSLHPGVRYQFLLYHPRTQLFPSEPQRFAPEESLGKSSCHRSAGGDFQLCPGKVAVPRHAEDDRWCHGHDDHSWGSFCYPATSPKNDRIAYPAIVEYDDNATKLLGIFWKSCGYFMLLPYLMVLYDYSRNKHGPSFDDGKEMALSENGIHCMGATKLPIVLIGHEMMTN